MPGLVAKGQQEMSWSNWGLMPKPQRPHKWQRELMASMPGILEFGNLGCGIALLPLWESERQTHLEPGPLDPSSCLPRVWS